MKPFMSASVKTATMVKEDIKNQVDVGINLVDMAKHFFVNNLGNIIFGLVLLFVGINIAKLARVLMHRIFRAPKYDQTVNNFVSDLVYYAILFLTIVSALSCWGVPQSSFVAIVGGLGLAVGLALQNNMSNFASGILLLIFKPFKVGDWIQVTGDSDIVGTVARIELLYTAILNKEKRTIFVPNSKLTSNAITNSSFVTTRFIRFDVGISYDNDHHEAIRILKDIFNASPYVLNKDSFEVGITSFGDNAVNISAFPEVPKDHALEVFYWAMSKIKDEFDANNIGIPYPQRDIHVYHMNELVVNQEQGRISQDRSDSTPTQKSKPSSLVSVKGSIVEKVPQVDEVPTP